MAGDDGTGMDASDMKRLLVMSRKDKVNCAVGQPAQGATALLLMDKVKPGKALVKDLKKQFEKAKNLRWGTVSVDTDDDPKQAVFELNKGFSGIARSLTKTLKGTGFSKVEVK